MSLKYFQAVVFGASISFITYFVVTNRMGAQNRGAAESEVEPDPVPSEQVPADPEQHPTPEPEAVPPEY